MSEPATGQVISVSAFNRPNNQNSRAAFERFTPDGAPNVELELLVQTRTADLTRLNKQLASELQSMRQLVTELTLERDRAHQADRAKSMFLAAMSHDLRTPLNAIIGFSEMMLHEVFGAIEHPRYTGYIDDIHTSGRLLLDLINNILDLSKIEAGKRDLLREPLDVAPLAENCLSLVARATGGRDVAVDLVTQGSGRIYADELALRQILLNLLSNAVKFTPDGGRVDIAVADSPNGSTLITIADTGCGMDEAGLRTALTTFGQVPNGTCPRTGGSGLGLPIVVRLVELHGGRFRIDSAPGRGTTVHLWFPATPVELHRP
jgi:two-component system cell cycle sensor histidine kinase PleC